MSRVFISGSSDGLGLLAAKKLLQLGHGVVLHARNEKRAKETLEQTPGAEKVLIADLSSISETKSLAAQINALGPMDAVIHNAGVYQVSGNSEDGVPLLFAVNSLAPYILTCLIQKPKRLIYLSSDMHLYADGSLTSLSGEALKGISYSDTKFHDVILAMSVAERWKNVYANAVHPGWVPTKMGGSGAPDNLHKGYETQVWLAISDDKETQVSGQYFHHKKPSRYLAGAKDKIVQEKFLSYCERISGVKFPD